VYIFTGPGLAACRRRPLSSNVRPHKSTMLHRLQKSLLALLLLLIAFSEVQAQPRVPESSLYTPKPSQDLSWAHGNWVAKGEHPVQGAIVEWRVAISPNGQFVAELVRTEGVESGVERGQWIAIDREIWSFITSERDRRQLPLPTHDLYTILVISPSALELRHIENGKVMRLERGST
jgi:hypothetical protein